MAFSYYKSLTLDKTQAGGADSTDWPLAIALDGNVQAADADLKTVGNGGYVQNSNGYDIRPYADSALTTPLTYELVYYQATTGKLEMHVKIPTLSVSSNTVIYLAFGDSSISTNGSSTGVWSNGYQGVYHLPDGTTLSANDSTSNANNGTLTNTPSAVAGEMDGGAQFVRTFDQYINLGNPASLQITGDISLSTWLLLTTNPSTNDYQLVSKDKDTGGRAYTFDQNAGNPRFYINGGGGGDIIIGSTAFTTSTWYHVVGQWKSSTKQFTLYVNGASDATPVTGSSTSIPSATANVLLARREYAGFENPLDGYLDESRIATTVRSSDWILADYNSQKASSTFITWGALTPINTSPFWQFTWKYWQ